MKGVPGQGYLQQWQMLEKKKKEVKETELFDLIQLLTFVLHKGMGFPGRDSKEWMLWVKYKKSSIQSSKLIGLSALMSTRYFYNFFKETQTPNTTGMKGMLLEVCGWKQKFSIEPLL